MEKIRKILNMINDKIIEGENYEESDLSNEYIEGCIHGLRMAKTIIMDNLTLQETVIVNYLEFLEDKELEDNLDSIKLYSGSLHYDLWDDIDIERVSWGVPKDLESVEAVNYIEDKVVEILLER